MNKPLNRVEQAAQFLDALGNGLEFWPDERLVITMPPEMSGVPGESPEDARKRNFTFGVQPYKRGKYLGDKGNGFVCISSFKHHINDKGQKKWSRRASDWGHGLALMVDDIGSGIGSKGNLGLSHFYDRLPPTAVVETSPNNNQLWYFFDVPEPNQERFAAFLEGFVSNVLNAGGDRTIKDISRIGRFPLGVNNKRDGKGNYKYEGGEFKPRLVDADYSRRYSMQEIADKFGFPIAVRRKEDLSNMRTDAERAYASKEGKADARALDVAVHLHDKYGMDIGATNTGGYRICCPWGDEHSGRNGDDAFIRGPVRGGDIDYVFKCAHDSCIKAKRHWNEFVDKFVLEWVVGELDKANAEDRINYYEWTLEGIKK